MVEGSIYRSKYRNKYRCTNKFCLSTFIFLPHETGKKSGEVIVYGMSDSKMQRLKCFFLCEVIPSTEKPENDND